MALRLRHAVRRMQVPRFEKAVGAAWRCRAVRLLRFQPLRLRQWELFFSLFLSAPSPLVLPMARCLFAAGTGLDGGKIMMSAWMLICSDWVECWLLLLHCVIARSERRSEIPLQHHLKLNIAPSSPPSTPQSLPQALGMPTPRTANPDTRSILHDSRYQERWIFEQPSHTQTWTPCASA